LPATIHLFVLSLHDALPILPIPSSRKEIAKTPPRINALCSRTGDFTGPFCGTGLLLFLLLFFALVLLEIFGQEPGHILELRYVRSEEHTSELQSRENLVCRL